MRGSARCASWSQRRPTLPCPCRRSSRPPGLRVVGRASTPEELERLLRVTRPGVVVFDAGMSVEALAATRAAEPHIGIVAVWPHGIESQAVNAVVLPTAVRRDLVAAVRRATPLPVRPRRWVSSPAAAAVGAPLAAARSRPHRGGLELGVAAALTLLLVVTAVVLRNGDVGGTFARGPAARHRAVVRRRRSGPAAGRGVRSSTDAGTLLDRRAEAGLDAALRGAEALRTGTHPGTDIRERRTGTDPGTRTPSSSRASGRAGTPPTSGCTRRSAPGSSGSSSTSAWRPTRPARSGRWRGSPGRTPTAPATARGRAGRWRLRRRWRFRRRRPGLLARPWARVRARPRPRPRQRARLRARPRPRARQRARVRPRRRSRPRALSPA